MTQYSSSGSSSSGSSSAPQDINQVSRAIEEKLKVAIRIKPLGSDEANTRSLHVLNNKIIILNDADSDSAKRNAPRQYLYDIVFGEDSTQEAVYEGTAKTLVQDVLNGYNATVFAYGATGAGKTHTMVGTSSDPGIMVRALNDIFLTTQKLSEDVNYKVTMSYMEIYNENIRDLLNPGSGYLELREDSRGRNVQVPGLTEVSTTSTQEVMQLLHKGNKARTVEPTAANETSSRSHALLSVTVRGTSQHVSDSNHGIRTRVKQGRLFMIDLAGSERAKQTKNKGKRLQEGAHINRSLLALGNCINALSGGARYVNYRDSKLTRLLKEALSGNCRTVMIAHVSPAASNRDETKNTLVYADRATKLSNKVSQRVMDMSFLHVAQYRNIISDLKSEISRLQNKMKDDGPRRNEDTDQGSSANDFKAIREKIIATFKKQMELRKQLMHHESCILSLSMSAEQQNAIISHWDSRRNQLYGSSRDSYNRRPETSTRIEEFDDVDVDLEDDTIVQQAWNELAEISAEQERRREMRDATERELEANKKLIKTLEDQMPERISSNEERELLNLMLRVHELEADKMMLQTERLVKLHELRRRELLLLRYDRQRQISDEIITRQRRIMEDGRLALPSDLQELYMMYQQEIQTATFIDSSLTDFVASPSASAGLTDKLPPITSRLGYHGLSDSRVGSSSTDSDWEPSPLPPIPEPPEVEKVMGPVVHPLISPSILFPPISSVEKSNQSV